MEKQPELLVTKTIKKYGAGAGLYFTVAERKILNINPGEIVYVTIRKQK